MRLETVILVLTLSLCLITWAPLADARKCRRKGVGKNCGSGRRALRTGETTSRGSGGKRGNRKGRGRAGRKVARSHQAPKWRRHPPRDTLLIQREGSEAVLTCKASGRPRPKVTWNKDGAPMRFGKDTKYERSRWKLEIKRVSIGDSGNYTCVITNDLGQLRWTYTLRVLENQPISEISILERPKNQTAHVGDTVVFMCRSDTWPPPSVHWTRKTNDKIVVEIVQMENNTLAEVLVLHNVTKKDAGEYTCYIGNDVANLQLTATLTVIEEGESLPFEPKCALHIRRQILVDNTFGCQTKEPVEITYCMGSCGRSYFIPTMVTTDDTAMQQNHLNQTCQCCVGLVQGIRIVHLECPFGEQKRGFFQLLRDCECRSCALEGEIKRHDGGETVKIQP